MLRANSRLRTALGLSGLEFLESAAKAIGRLLPHVDVEGWVENEQGRTGATWGDRDRRHINVCIRLSLGSVDRAIHAEVRRRAAPAGIGRITRTLDPREFDLCGRVARRIGELLSSTDIRMSEGTLEALAVRFDEDVVAASLQEHHGLKLNVAQVFEAIRGLAGQTYENKPIAFGCILDPNDNTTSIYRFPSDFFRFKKYKALTDGFRTAYMVSSSGGLTGFADLENAELRRNVTDHQMYPEWAVHVARLSHSGRCGICLTRAGDVLVFEAGTLRFAYRFGHWRYMNHAHIIDLLKNIARVQNVPTKLVGRVTKSVYRAALDVSFRRTGGLIVVLRARRELRSLVKIGDAIGDDRRLGVDTQLDAALPGNTVQGISRRVVAELAGLDGAVVIANSGALLAYGCIVQPRRRGRLRGTEGSRTKAAIGASAYGLAVKISADGDITVYSNGEAVLSV